MYYFWPLSFLVSSKHLQGFNWCLGSQIWWGESPKSFLGKTHFDSFTWIFWAGSSTAYWIGQYPTVCQKIYRPQNRTAKFLAVSEVLNLLGICNLDNCTGLFHANFMLSKASRIYKIRAASGSILVDNRPFGLNGQYSWICGRYYI